MTITWALVADRSRASLFQLRARGQELDVIESVNHESGRLQNRELVTDTPGHAQEDPTEREASNFARQLAEWVRQYRMSGRFERLIIAAEPSFLGLINGALDGPTKKLVVGEVPKHLLGRGDGDLRKHLSDVMPPL